MPKAKAKPKTTPTLPVAPKAPEPVVAPPTSPPVNLPILYPELEIDEYSTASAKGPLDIEWIVTAMGWETESEYKKRKVAANPGSKPEQWNFGDGVQRDDGSGIQPVHCRNLAGEKVIAWNNAQNRPFDEKWCDELIHTILYGQWAGPFTVPGETVNGETIRISKYGRVLSGQHQMTACKLAAERLLYDRQNGVDIPTDPKYPMWVKHGEPFIETIVIKGMSEDPRILMTVDYVKPRTAADVFYTSEVFKSATPIERKDLCRILAGAVDLLWTRTDAKGYRTHPEIVAFLERHRKLLDCVLHIAAENAGTSGRRLGKLRLSPGHCSALMYLMGCGSDTTTEYSDTYRNEMPPTEKNLDWSLWDKAEEFWTLLAGGRDFATVRMALSQLIDSTPYDEANQGLGGRGPEKFAILAKAWERWKEHPATGGPAFDQADLEPGGDLCLAYNDLDDKGNKLPDGQIRLLDVADFYGIDCPESTGTGKTTVSAPMPPAPTKEEIERATEEALKRRAAAKK